jgi:HK97 family phage portal protein
MGLGGWFARHNGLDTVTATQEPSADERALSVADPMLAFLLGYSVPGAPLVSESTALTLSAVYRAVSIVAGSIGSLPLRTLETTSQGQKQRVPSFLDNVGGDRYTPVEFAELATVHLLMRGNAYLQHIYDRSGRLVSLYPVPPICVTPEWDFSLPGDKAFKVNALGMDGRPEAETFDSRTMTQIMGPSLDGLRGLSCIEQARLSFGTGLAGEKSANRQFNNGAMIGGLVSPADSEDDLDAAEAKTVKDAINRSMLGPENAGDIAVVSKALKFQSWQMSAQDAQFIESRTFSVDEVGRWFGVPPHLLGLVEKSTSWGQGIAEQNRGLARYTLTSWTGRIEQRLTRLLPAGRFAEFDYTAFVKPSPEDEIGLLIQQVNSGLLTLNEARAIRNMGPLPGGDLPRTPAGAAVPGAAPAGSIPQEVQ